MELPVSVKFIKKILFCIVISLFSISCGSDPYRAENKNNSTKVEESEIDFLAHQKQEDFFQVPRTYVIERMLSYDDFKILSIESVSSETAGTMKMRVQFSDAQVMDVKWKPALIEAGALSHSSRREIAAYQIQKLFLDPEDFVVPPTVAKCIDIAQYNKFIPEARAQFEMAPKCYFGTLSEWINDTDISIEILNFKRFQESMNSSNQYGYAYHIGNLNLFTYLVNHQDGYFKNFLISSNPNSSRVYVVDNGASFLNKRQKKSSSRSPWGSFRVGFVPKTTYKKIMRIDRSVLKQEMEVLEEFNLNDGIFVNSHNLSDAFNKSSGVRYKKGHLQFGLTTNEIQFLLKRIEDIQDKVSGQELGLF